MIGTVNKIKHKRILMFSIGFDLLSRMPKNDIHCYQCYFLNDIDEDKEKNVHTEAGRDLK